VLEKALALASSDELTGLTNRRGFYERFEIEIERSRRNPSAMCVVMIDVDHFKRLNDTYGHLAGDRVLKALADLFQQNVRRSDVVCRFGGEEFAFLLPDTHAQSACELLERIRKKVERLRIRGSQGEAIRTTISAGVMQVDVTHSMGRPLQEVISEALTEADEALYQAKSSGRNRICQAESAA
jgi:diguanylate cyclase (GGDEF)-like protein